MAVLGQEARASLRPRPGPLRGDPPSGHTVGVAKTDFERIFETLSRARVRYLVAGGVAVVLHGHPRFTADLDLILALDPPNVRKIWPIRTSALVG